MKMQNNAYRLILCAAGLLMSFLLQGAAEFGMESSKPIPPCLKEQVEYMPAVLRTLRLGNKEEALKIFMGAAKAENAFACQFLIYSYEKGKFLTGFDENKVRGLKRFAEQHNITFAAGERRLCYLNIRLEKTMLLSQKDSVKAERIERQKALPSDLMDQIKLFATGRLSDDDFFACVWWTESSSYRMIFEFLKKCRSDSSLLVEPIRVHRLVLLIKEWAFINGEQEEWKKLGIADFQLMIKRCGKKEAPFDVKRILFNGVLESLNIYYHFFPGEVLICFDAIFLLYWRYFHLTEPRALSFLLSFAAEYYPLFFMSEAKNLLDRKIDRIMKLALYFSDDWSKLAGTPLSLENIIESSFAKVGASQLHHRALACFFREGTAYHQYYVQRIVDVIETCSKKSALAIELGIMVLFQSKIDEIRIAIEQLIESGPI